MEHDRLPTEEIIKALQFKIPQAIGYIDGNAAKVIQYSDILELINQLQADNEELKARQKCHFELLNEKNQKIVEQMSEIDRLKKIAGDSTLQEIVAQNCTLNEENAELQNQVSAWTKANDQKMIRILQLQEQVEALNGQVVKLHGCSVTNEELERTVRSKAKEIIEKAKFLIEERNGMEGFDLEDVSVDGIIIYEVFSELLKEYVGEEL